MRSALKVTAEIYSADTEVDLLPRGTTAPDTVVLPEDTTAPPLPGDTAVEVATARKHQTAQPLQQLVVVLVVMGTRDTGIKRHLIMRTLIGMLSLPDNRLRLFLDLPLGPQEAVTKILGPPVDAGVQAG